MKRAVAEMERIMLKAMVDPMMINASKQVKTKVTYTEFAGTPFERTLERKEWNGSPLSRANDHT